MIMENNVLDRLIEMLCAERGESVPALADSQKADFFRALCNVRPPIPATEEFIKLQDEYLSQRTKERGIVDVNSFFYKNDIALWRGDITRLNADAIVNACNPALLGCFQPLHNCIDNIIHSNAGIQVRFDCNAIMQGREEPNGKVEVTKAYNLPSMFIFHTVGPVVRGQVTDTNRKDLQSCYISCLNEAERMGLDSIAFCCISTGVYGYPKEQACRLAVQTIKEWKQNADSTLKVIFNVFLAEDEKFYERELARQNQ